MNSGPGDKRSGISPPRGSPRIVKNGVSGGMGHFLIPNSSSSSSSNEIGDGKTIRSTAAISHRNSVIGIIRWSKPWGRNKQERGIFSCVQPKKKKKKNSFSRRRRRGGKKFISDLLEEVGGTQSRSSLRSGFATLRCCNAYTTRKRSFNEALNRVSIMARKPLFPRPSSYSIIGVESSRRFERR